ncbi:MULTISPECIES: hypothetical protein [unclassified Streptomyces]|uniref:hypothetical protein n=1 Tax=unclassified Streptomyces TaxID=2593676 RepID=UPI0029670849|nr:hypothetical protein [Streptomyces sp. SJL17-1]
MIPRSLRRAVPGPTARLRLTALAVLPVLAFSAACGSGDDSAGGAGKNDEIASVPETTTVPPSERNDTTPSARPAGKSAFYDAQLDYVRCMRVKGGYEDFPDPKLSGHLDWGKVEEISSRPGQMEAAKGGRNGVCVDELQKVMLAEPERNQQKDYESMLEHAQCMRDNGVSRFTNPTMSGGNAQPGGDPNPASPAIDSDSPVYKQARQACKSKLLDGLDGMQ